MPPFEIFLAGSALLFFFDRPLPRLVRLFGGLPIRSLARIIGGLGLAHGDTSWECSRDNNANPTGFETEGRLVIAGTDRAGPPGAKMKGPPVVYPAASPGSKLLGLKHATQPRLIKTTLGCRAGGVQKPIQLDEQEFCCGDDTEE